MALENSLSFEPKISFGFMTARSLSIIVLSSLWILQGCRPARMVEDGSYLISKSKIHVNKSNDIKYEGDLENLKATVRQKPYRKILGVFPFHIGVWNFAANRNQEKKIWSYLKNEVGEAPPLFEQVLLEKSIDHLRQNLRNEGYFDAVVTADTNRRKKKIKIHYYLETDEAYTIRKVGYSFEDTALIKEFRAGVSTVFKPGARFDAGDFETERDRLTNNMKNLGYFTFEKIHVIFDVDTNLPGKKFDVSVRLRNLRNSQTIGNKDTIIQSSHRKHYVNRIIVNESFDARRRTQVHYDTLEFRDITLLYIGEPYVTPVRIHRNIFVKPGESYSLKKTNYTYDRINSLGNFRFIDMKYVTATTDSTVPMLDLRINLTRNLKQSFSIETVGTHRSGNLGISAGVNYRNRNVFKGAEQLNWRVYGGLESQRTNSTEGDINNEVINNVSIFNTYEFGTQLSLTIPDFLLRTTKREIPWAKEPKTNISASADRQVRPQYERNLVNLSYQYTMRLRTQDQLVFSPVDLSVIQLTKSEAFERQLQQTNNALLINSYNNHIIPAGRLSYANTTQDFQNPLKNFYLYRINLEVAGNLLRGMGKVMGMPYDAENDSYTIQGIAFAQYVKLDANYVKYNHLSEHNKLVYRIFGGIGIPLKNLNVLPFERSFFGGGSNGMRAWRARALGPGSLSDTATYGIDQVAESQFEMNIEYRFHIVKMLEGALFTDIGNIWLIRKDEKRPGANFAIDRFYNEIAIAPGAGIRLDFNFFVLRFDGGLQLKDPALPTGERWLFQPKTLTEQYRSAANDRRQNNGQLRVAEWDRSYRPQLTINLAIHYPF